MKIYFFAYSKSAPSVRYRGKYLLEEIKSKTNINYRFILPEYSSYITIIFLIIRTFFHRSTDEFFIFQKFATKSIYVSLLKILCKRSINTFFDMDDALHTIRDKNIINFFAKNCSKVLVGSTSLLSYFSNYNKNVYLITTPTYPPSHIKQSKNKVFSIGWIGIYQNHVNNLFTLLFPSILKINKKIVFTIIGVSTPEQKKEIIEYFKNNENVNLEIPMNINWNDEDFINSKISSFDIGVSPLLDNEFNNGRSAFKLKQYLSCNVPVLASPVGENKIYIEQGFNGYICSTNEDWEQKINYFLELDESKYQVYIKNCKEYYINSDFRAENVSDKLISILLETDDNYDLLNQCPFCNSAKIKILYSTNDNINNLPGFFYLSKCKSCGFYFQNPRIKKQSISTYYPDNTFYYSIENYKIEGKIKEILKYQYHYFLDEKKIFSKQIKWYLLGLIRKNMLFIPGKENSKIVELGCSNGRNLKLYKDLGWEVKGYDFSESALKYGKQLGLDIEKRDIENPDLFANEYNKYDALLLLMVLEHIYDFEKLISLSNSLLKKDGTIFITIPTYNGSFYLFKKHTYALQLPNHLYFFSKKHIKTLLSRHGFSNIRVHFQKNKSDFNKSADFYLKSERNLANTLLRINLIKRICGYLYSKLSVLNFSSRITITAQKNQQVDNLEKIYFEANKKQ